MCKGEYVLLAEYNLTTLIDFMSKTTKQVSRFRLHFIYQAGKALSINVQVNSRIKKVINNIVF